MSINGKGKSAGKPSKIANAKLGKARSEETKTKIRQSKAKNPFKQTPASIAKMLTTKRERYGPKPLL